MAAVQCVLAFLVLVVVVVGVVDDDDSDDDDDVDDDKHRSPCADPVCPVLTPGRVTCVAVL